MKVEVWSDIVCPWCGLGQHRLEKALEGFAHRDEVQIVRRSFQLDPACPPELRPVRDTLAEKTGLRDKQLTAALRHVEELAEREGLTPYVVGDNVVGNTRLAHELLAMATDQGLEEAAWKRLGRAYFGERRNVFELESLLELAKEIGLDEAEARAALEDGRYRARVEVDSAKARKLGAAGVPFFVVNRRYAIEGAQSVKTFRRALEKAWENRALPQPLQSSEGEPVAP